MICKFMLISLLFIDLYSKVGGVEVDLLALSNAIKSNGGLQRVIDKNLWPNVVKMLRVPKIVSSFKMQIFVLSFDCLFLFLSFRV